MPISLDELAAEVSEPVEINIGTEEAPKIITIRYKPNGITPELEDRLFVVAQRSQIGSVYRTMLLDCLTEWDIIGTLPPYPDAVDDGDSPEEFKQRQEKIAHENELRRVPQRLPLTWEAISLVPVNVLEKIVVAIQGAQIPKKPTSTSSRGSFGAAPVAPYQRGTG